MDHTMANTLVVFAIEDSGEAFFVHNCSTVRKHQ